MIVYKHCKKRIQWNLSIVNTNRTVQKSFTKGGVHFIEVYPYLNSQSFAVTTYCESALIHEDPTSHLWWDSLHSDQPEKYFSELPHDIHSPHNR